MSEWSSTDLLTTIKFCDNQLVFDCLVELNRSVLISGIILIYNWSDCFAQTPKTMKFQLFLVDNVMRALFERRIESKCSLSVCVSRLCILSFGCNRPEELFIYNWPDLSMRTYTHGWKCHLYLFTHPKWHDLRSSVALCLCTDCIALVSVICSLCEQRE